jgi:hypothetical protein
MSCPEGFDPFGERTPTLLEHTSACASCGDVLSVLGASKVVWKEEAASDDARAVFRERRLARTRMRRPARTAALSAVFFVGVGVASAWAFAPLFTAHERPPLAVPRSVETAAPTERAPHAFTSGNPASTPEPVETVAPAPSAEQPPPVPSSVRPAIVKAPTAEELWERGLARLDQGDRAGARSLFRSVIDAPRVEPELRRRAMFRWSEVLLASGDTTTPTDTLWQLVRGADASIGFDAALLLERCAPDDRPRIWDTYLARTRDEPFRTQAVERRSRAR